MDIKIEKATVTADKDKLLDKNWTVEMEDAVYVHFDEAEELAEILMKEILKDDE